jgi:hypothetical protein
LQGVGVFERFAASADALLARLEPLLDGVEVEAAAAQHRQNLHDR